MPPINPGTQSTTPAFDELQGRISGYIDALVSSNNDFAVAEKMMRELQEAYHSQGIEVQQLDKDIVQVSAHIKNLYERDLKKLGISFKETQEVVKSFSEEARRLIGPLNQLIQGKRTLGKHFEDLLERAAQTGLGFGKLGVVLALGAQTSYSFVKGMEGARESQLALGQALAQVGVDVKTQVIPGVTEWQQKQISMVRDLGVTAEDFAKIMKSLTAGIVGAGGDSESLSNATRMVASMQIRYGMEFSQAADLMVKATRFTGATVTEAGDVFSTLREKADSAGLSIDVYSSSLDSMMMGLKGMRAGIGESTSLVGTFSEQIRRGALSVEQIVQLVSPYKLGLGPQAFLATQMAQKGIIQQGDIGSMIASMQRLTAPQYLGGVRQIVGGFGAGGSAGNQTMIQMAIAQTLGLGLQTPMFTFRQTMDQSTQGFERFAGLTDAGSGSMGKFISSTEELYASVNPLSREFDFLTEKIKAYRGFFGTGTTAAVGGAAGIGAGLGTMALLNAATTVLPGGIFTKILISLLAAGGTQKILGSFAEGGMVPQTGIYRLHAGEEVKSTRNVSNGVNVSVNVSGMDKTQVASAMDKAKDEVLREVERQWNLSQPA